MLVLDTNVLSELIHPQGDRRIVAWVDRIRGTNEVALTAVTAAELRFGVRRLPDGMRKSQLNRALEAMLAHDFPGAVMPFDEPASIHYAAIVASRETQGRPISIADAQIAAICRKNGAELATRNMRDFADCGIRLLDPWA